MRTRWSASSWPQPPQRGEKQALPGLVWGRGHCEYGLAHRGVCESAHMDFHLIVVQRMGASQGSSPGHKRLGEGSLPGRLGFSLLCVLLQ